jgi:hypothetical protein
MTIHANNALFVFITKAIVGLLLTGLVYQAHANNVAFPAVAGNYLTAAGSIKCETAFEKGSATADMLVGASVDGYWAETAAIRALKLVDRAKRSQPNLGLKTSAQLQALLNEERADEYQAAVADIQKVFKRYFFQSALPTQLRHLRQNVGPDGSPLGVRIYDDNFGALIAAFTPRNEDDKLPADVRAAKIEGMRLMSECPKCLTELVTTDHHGAFFDKLNPQESTTIKLAREFKDLLKEHGKVKGLSIFKARHTFTISTNLGDGARRILENPEHYARKPKDLDLEMRAAWYIDFGLFRQNWLAFYSQGTPTELALADGYVLDEIYHKYGMKRVNAMDRYFIVGGGGRISALDYMNRGADLNHAANDSMVKMRQQITQEIYRETWKNLTNPELRHQRAERMIANCKTIAGYLAESKWDPMELLILRRTPTESMIEYADILNENVFILNKTEYDSRAKELEEKLGVAPGVFASWFAMGLVPNHGRDFQVEMKSADFKIEALDRKIPGTHIIFALSQASQPADPATYALVTDANLYRQPRTSLAPFLKRIEQRYKELGHRAIVEARQMERSAKLAEVDGNSELAKEKTAKSEGYRIESQYWMDLAEKIRSFVFLRGDDLIFSYDLRLPPEEVAVLIAEHFKRTRLSE